MREGGGGFCTTHCLGQYLNDCSPHGKELDRTSNLAFYQHVIFMKRTTNDVR